MSGGPSGPRVTVSYGILADILINQNINFPSHARFGADSG
jgi:hypothetical protein